MLMAQCSTARLSGVNASTCDTLGHALQSLGEILRAFDIHNSNLEIEYLYLSRPYYLLWLICRITWLASTGHIYLSFVDKIYFMITRRKIKNRLEKREM